MVEIQSILAYFKYKQAASVSCSLNRLQDAVRYVRIQPSLNVLETWKSTDSQRAFLLLKEWIQVNLIIMAVLQSLKKSSEGLRKDFLTIFIAQCNCKLFK